MVLPQRIQKRVCKQCGFCYCWCKVQIAKEVNNNEHAAASNGVNGIFPYTIYKCNFLVTDVRDDQYGRHVEINNQIIEEIDLVITILSLKLNQPSVAIDCMYLLCL
jgi:hypothetical protein